MDRQAKDGDWLSLGTEAMPLRDDAVRQAEDERSERIRLLLERGRRTHTPALVLLATLAVLASALVARLAGI